VEVISGLSLKAIFCHNDNWQRFLANCKSKLRSAIITNVTKMMLCCSKELGYHQYTCPRCHYTITVPHSCKCRFCSSCGKKATDNWICKNYNILPKTKWQHITFTMPSELWDFFWLNRHLFNPLPALAANIIKKLAAKKGITPGMFAVIHTFKRNLLRNVHIHLSTTLGGLNSNNQWKNNLYFDHLAVKKMWRYALITLLREQYKSGNLKLPPKLNHIKNYEAFNSWLDFLYKKQWVVFLQKPSENHKRNIDYLGKYLKRPPIGETRIKNYDGKHVTFEYLDHHDNSKKNAVLDVMEFISRLIMHIPDKNFRCIRYYGFLANRLRGKLLPLVHKLLQSTVDLSKNLYLTWQNLISISFGFDPLMCPKCHCNLLLSDICFPMHIFCASSLDS
jgi:hypothetical protein